MRKKILVLGGGGFIGNHLVNRLKELNHFVRAVDLKNPEFSESVADEFIKGDLRDYSFCKKVMDSPFDEVYQLAADMGGAGYIFTGLNDAVVMHNSAMVNLHSAKILSEVGIGKIFYSSSACIYPKYNQEDPDNPLCKESSAYPAAPDSEYGWEKLFSERMYESFSRNFDLDCRIARFHNIFGPEGTFEGGKEKAPAAICRKVAEASSPGSIEVWGDGKQTRSFLFIDDCLDGVEALMSSDFREPVNIGSEEMISINDFTKMIIDISQKTLKINNVTGPEGVRGRNSDNELMKSITGWSPKINLREGMERTYQWVSGKVNERTLS